MPSSYSSNLLLELMADGENEGLWGDITNTNLEILGRAAGGVGNITLAGTTHTLTVTQGTLSEGQYSTLVLGGSPTGTNTITISPNTVTRTFLVQNSSGQDAIFTQGSGDNVTVPNGGTAIVFCSGTGASSSVTDITADFLRGVNNLSDLDDPDTALQNLGLTATAAEINKLDGATLDLAAVTATAAEVNVLDGVTATTAELNKLDGFTGTAADLNYAEDLRATGVTATEFNYLDGVDSAIQPQLDGKITAVSTGGGLTGGGSSGSVSVSHANTSSQGNVNTSGTTVVDSVSVDTYGHVTSMGTRDMASSIRSSIGDTTFPSVGSYMLLRAVAGGPFLYNDTYTGQNLSAASVSGEPQLSSSTVIKIIGGSWRGAGRSDAGTLTTASRANETTLWVRYA